MIDWLQSHAVPIVIAVSFYVVGFFGIANLLPMTEREIVLGLAAGSVGGLSVLGAVVWSERRAARKLVRA